MTTIYGLFIALGALLIVASPARAHRPYFTQVEKITLPDGQRGELRVLNGDGIFFADPQRVLLLNADGNLIARSYQAVPMVISCEHPDQCRIVDLSSDTILEIDPATFRFVPIVYCFRDEVLDQIWVM